MLQLVRPALARTFVFALARACLCAGCVASPCVGRAALLGPGHRPAVHGLVARRLCVLPYAFCAGCFVWLLLVELYRFGLPAALALCWLGGFAPLLSCCLNGRVLNVNAVSGAKLPAGVSVLDVRSWSHACVTRAFMRSSAGMLICSKPSTASYCSWRLSTSSKPSPVWSIILR